MRKIFVLLLLMSALAAVFIGCGKSTGNGVGGKVIITGSGA